MSKAIVTFGVGKHARLLEIALVTFKAFADRHGWDLYQAKNIGQSRPAPWYKLPSIKELLEDYDEVLWLGADLVIVDGREDLTAPPDAWQAMVAHHTGDGEVPNTEVWLCRKAMIPVLDEAWKLESWLMHGWWEQAAIMDLMGYQVRYPAHLVEETPLYINTHFLEHGWNMHCWDRPIPEHPRIQHATMYDDRECTMTEWVKQAEGWMNERIHQPA